MAKTFQLDVVSPEATVWSGQAEIVVARTFDGELGVMADHEPLMGALATGPVTIQADSGERITIGVHGGFIQVLNNQVTLITDRAELAEGRDQAKELAQRLAEDQAEAEA
ncbi:MAG: F0F1 ATP synthase subunit epsilon [Acidimicrobiia bacterium]